MKKNRIIRFILLLLAFVELYSCSEEWIGPTLLGKMKAEYLYSSSEATEPYAVAQYFYDPSWNLVKKVVRVKPDAVTFMERYFYDDGRLMQEDHYAVPQGASGRYIREENLALYDRYLYRYPAPEWKVEVHYDMEERVLVDSAIYEYKGNDLVCERHYEVRDGGSWSITYRYDREGNLIEKREEPTGFRTEYIYENGRKVRERQYDKQGTLIYENRVVHTTQKGYEIVEVYRVGNEKNQIFSRKVYRGDLLVEFIRYHPTFPGAEWVVIRYAYY